MERRKERRKEGRKEGRKERRKGGREGGRGEKEREKKKEKKRKKTTWLWIDYSNNGGEFNQNPLYFFQAWDNGTQFQEDDKSSVWKILSMLKNQT